MLLVLTVLTAGLGAAGATYCLALLAEEDEELLELLPDEEPLPLPPMTE